MGPPGPAGPPGAEVIALRATAMQQLQLLRPADSLRGAPRELMASGAPLPCPPRLQRTLPAARQPRGPCAALTCLPLPPAHRRGRGGRWDPVDLPCFSVGSASLCETHTLTARFLLPLCDPRRVEDRPADGDPRAPVRGRPHGAGPSAGWLVRAPRPRNPLASRPQAAPRPLPPSSPAHRAPTLRPARSPVSETTQTTTLPPRHYLPGPSQRISAHEYRRLQCSAPSPSPPAAGSSTSTSATRPPSAPTSCPGNSGRLTAARSRSRRTGASAAGPSGRCADIRG